MKEYTQKYNNVYVCGTSIFRNLNDEQRTDFLNKFYNETGVNFDIISPEKENELTVFGTVRNVNQKVAVFIGGGGSTEIAIYDGKIKETVNKVSVKDREEKYNSSYLGNDDFFTRNYKGSKFSQNTF